MIRIVKELRVWDVDSTGSYVTLPLIPASATCSSSVKETDNGLQEDISLSARLQWSADRNILHRHLKLQLTFDNGDIISLGDYDMPVRLTVNETDSLSISTTFQRRL